MNHAVIFEACGINGIIIPTISLVIGYSIIYVRICLLKSK